jgi:hypothetical protein
MTGIPGPNSAVQAIMSVLTWMVAVSSCDGIRWRRDRRRSGGRVGAETWMVAVSDSAGIPVAAVRRSASS